MSLDLVKTKPLIKGNYSKATKVDEERVIKLTKYPQLRQRPFFTPQRLFITAPLDVYGRPQTTFTVQSKLINPLPPNTMCYCESFFMNNIVGPSNPSRYGVFQGNITSTTWSSGGTFQITILINPNPITFTLYDIISFTTSEGYNVEAFVSTASQSTPTFTILDPTSSYSGKTVPIIANPDFTAGFSKTSVAQLLQVDYTGYNAYCPALLGTSCINVELLNYTSPEVFDTISSNYSQIIASIPTPPIYNRTQLPQEMGFYYSSLLNQNGYPISDPELINNKTLTFRITYNTGGPNLILPQPASQNSPQPYNLAPNYTATSGNVVIPWGAGMSGSTSPAGFDNYIAPTTQYFVPTYNTVPMIKFALCFYPLGTGDTSDQYLYEK